MTNTVYDDTGWNELVVIARRCPTCHCDMRKSEVPALRSRAVARIGAPMPPPRRLPAWQCGSCGRIEPRIE